VGTKDVVQAAIWTIEVANALDNKNIVRPFTKEEKQKKTKGIVENERE